MMARINVTIVGPFKGHVDNVGKPMVDMYG
jgi:hypothetical protein